MSAKKQLTGMRGVYLVASELSRLGFIASPTSRSARGADILATDDGCKRAFSVQVKTKTTRASYWLLGSECKEQASNSHVYVFVDIGGGNSMPDFFVVSSRVVRKKAYVERFGKGIWYSFTVRDAMPFRNKWKLFRSRAR